MTAEIDEWICSLCGTSNFRGKECEICGEMQINIEYEEKLTNFKQYSLEIFIKLNVLNEKNDLYFENIMHCYYRSRSKDIDICDWYPKFYPVRKNHSTMKRIFNKHGFKIPTNRLDRLYNEEIKSQNNKLKSMFVNTDILSKLSINQEVINFQELNKMNYIPESRISKIFTDKDIWEFIIGMDSFTDMEMRKIITEFDFDSLGAFKLLMNYLSDNELGDYLKNSCVKGNVKLIHLKQAIQDECTVSSALDYLKNSCILCGDDFPMQEMVSIITCCHSFCKSCTFEWLKETIQTKFPCKWHCPCCEEYLFANIDKNLYYNQLKDNLSNNNELKSIFDLKLLQQQLMTSKKFHWCANEQCTNGFEADAVNKIQCPACKTFMCVNCKRMWQNEHEDKTCQEFELWLLKTDTDLSNLLNDIGVECPSCGMRYALAPGGCLHFDCRQCGAKFCGGCEQLFVDECSKKGCQMTSFHGHHPRNCLYFLRDYSTKELENMLKNSDYPKLRGKTLKKCEFMITNDMLKDVKCEKDVHSSTGLCEGHYKEYLVQFINRYKIDPADFVDCKPLNLMLGQMVLPNLTKLPTENNDQFKARLIKQVKENCLFYYPK